MKKNLLRLAFCLFTSGVVSAQAPDLDFSFSLNGFTLPKYMEGYSCGSNDIMVGNDGSIFLSGSSQTLDFTTVGLIWKYRPDGDEDLMFHDQGLLRVPIDGVSTFCQKQILLPDNKMMILVGEDEEPEDRMTMLKMDQEGTPDFSFGENGMAVDDFNLAFLASRNMTLLPDGSFIVSGYGFMHLRENLKFLLIKIKPDGQPDRTFGTNGFALHAIGENTAKSNGLFVQPDGKIVLTGYGVFNGLDKLVVARYHPDGQPDKDFGEDGLFVFQQESNSISRGYQVICLPDGKLVICGYMSTEVTNPDFLAIRLLENGQPDLLFNEKGMARIAVSPFADQARSMIIQPDGKILLGGYAHSNTPEGSAATIVRLLPDGQPDPSFGPAGIFFPDLGIGYTHIISLCLQPDGKLLAAGGVSLTSFQKALLMRIDLGEFLSANAEPNVSIAASVYPNPASDYIHVDYVVETEESLSIDLLDTRGSLIERLKSMQSISPAAYSESFCLEHKELNGVYIVRIAGVNTSRSIPVILHGQ